MRRAITTTAGTLAIGALSASVALAGGGVSDVAKGHGDAVAEVAQAVEAVGDATHGETVSAIARQHGEAVREAARAMAEEKAAVGKANGQGASEARGNNRN